MLEFRGLSDAGRLLEADLERAFWTTYRISSWNLRAVSRSWLGSTESAQSLKIFLSTWFSTIICLSASSYSSCYVAGHIRVLLWRSRLSGVRQSGQLYSRRFSIRTPHNQVTVLEEIVACRGFPSSAFVPSQF
jgi:hypothetical protein